MMKQSCLGSGGTDTNTRWRAGKILTVELRRMEKKYEYNECEENERNAQMVSLIQSPTLITPSSLYLHHHHSSPPILPSSFITPTIRPTLITLYFSPLTILITIHLPSIPHPSPDSHHSPHPPLTTPITQHPH
ncbi:hypothetical protein Pmani_018774 [Petrolisthes manimaculis]|uniref:Uncharacterized protein n=1 Tax=Petrolisthes manimaculis TaxID=1843537 RepID=A0AAE1PLT3_9EUCA|nr:hypothetical protein Pmani_018774 [Petrolisthes manimaculis]